MNVIDYMEKTIKYTYCGDICALDNFCNYLQQQNSVEQNYVIQRNWY